jgi:hypothetical protein
MFEMLIAHKVFPIACDLAKPEQVPGVIAQVHFDTILSCIRRHSRHDIHVNHCYIINATMHECVAYQLPDRQTQVQKDVGAIDVVMCVTCSCMRDSIALQLLFLLRCVLRCSADSNSNLDLCLQLQRNNSVFPQL